MQSEAASGGRQRDSLVSDVEALSSFPRDSAGEGERRSAHWIAGRLREAGAHAVEVRPYRGQATYTWTYAALALAAILAARLPRRLGHPVALAVLAGLEAQVRTTPPLGPTGHNVVARIPAAGERRRTLVLAAHHDAQRTGLIWNPALHRAGRERRLRDRAIPPYVPLAIPAVLAHRTRLGRAVLALLGALAVEQALGETVPGANDNATGVAALLALAERFAARPLPGTEVVLVAPGCEESGLHGMRAFLREARLDPASTLVVSLDTLGSGTPIVLRAEHTLVRHRYAERDLALVPEDVPRWSIGGWTDALAAKLAGLRALSLLSVDADGLMSNYHVPADTADRVDYASVEACAGVALAVAERFADEP